MPPKGVVKKAFQTTRTYRPGRAAAEDRSESEEETSDSEEEQQAPAKPQPKASSFPAGKKLAFDLSKAGKQTTAAAKAQEQQKAQQAKQPDAGLEGYVTASESESESDEDDSDRIAGRGEESGSSEEEDSSSDDEPAKLVRPKFIPKSQRAALAQRTKSADDQAAEEEARRKETANALLEAKVEEAAAERAAGRSWDDDEEPVDDVDDRDGLDPEQEHAAWKLRELKRVRRDRQALIEKEKEREEVERRRNMTAEEREAEDQAFIAAQKEEQEGRGKMAALQKYVHKGAFFQTEDQDMDDDVREAMQRDLAGARFEDDVMDKEALPEYMQVRDQTKVGRSGRTKYKDLRSEDTGSWGDSYRGKREFGGVDERFRPDGQAGGSERTGANNAPVGERRKRDDDAAGQGKRQRVD